MDDSSPQTVGVPATRVIIRRDSIERLHKELGHPSAPQRSRFTRNAETLPREDLRLLDRTVQALQSAFCDLRARRRTPSRPAVAVPHTTTPGQDIHLDVGRFRHPSTGPFQALVATDKFSLFVTGGVFVGPANAEKTIENYLNSISDNYARVTYDLGSNFRSDLFKSTLGDFN
jgi:hypothetical protein